MVFARGMVSDENLRNLEESDNYLYITALDKDQLAGVDGVNLDLRRAQRKTREKLIIF